MNHYDRDIIIRANVTQSSARHEEQAAPNSSLTSFIFISNARLSLVWLIFPASFALDTYLFICK